MTRFVILDPELTLNSVQEISTVDISAFGVGSYISIALPSFPGASITKSTSFLDLTSNPTGDFSAGPTASVSLSLSNPALPNTTQDSEARIPLTAVTGIDRTAITGVRFRLTATADCNVQIMALRVCAANWEIAPIDFDTLNQRVVHPPTRTGNPAQAIEFPTNAIAGMPTDFPIVFRAGQLSASHDPRPIDISLSAFFVTGSMTAANSIAFYLREQPVDNQIQLELDLLAQANLNAQNHQPDYGTATFTTRTQDALDDQNQTSLNTETQTDLGRLPDYISRDWIVVTLTWTSGGTTIDVRNADGIGYTFTESALLPIDANAADQGKYLFLIDLKGHSVRAQVYKSDQVGRFIGANSVIDTHEITDDTFIKKIKGRIGWYAHFADGDAYMSNFRTRGTSFGQMITKGLRSNTPVMGASLFTGSTSDNEYFSEIHPSPWGNGAIADDAAASASGNAKRITAYAGQSLQGIQTNYFLLDTFADFRISLDIKFPSEALLTPGGGIDFFLYGETGHTIPLSYPLLTGDKWEHINVTLEDERIQTGTYRLIGVQSLTDKDTVWWIDNIRISAPVINWSARSERQDAWGMTGNDWIDFKDTINTTNGGVVFRERGKSMQVRAEALRQSAEIRDFKVIPKYAELGRFIWDKPSAGSPPTAQIGVTTNGLTVVVSGALSADAEGAISAYYWSWGDDTYSYGGQVTHAYAKAGTYTIVLTVVDGTGNIGSTSAVVSVS